MIQELPELQEHRWGAPMGELRIWGNRNLRSTDGGHRGAVYICKRLASHQLASLCFYNIRHHSYDISTILRINHCSSCFIVSRYNVIPPVRPLATSSYYRLGTLFPRRLEEYISSSEQRTFGNPNYAWQC